MDWLIHVAVFDRIVVDVFDFLAHHHFSLDKFGMRAFLPELVIPVGFVAEFVVVQLFEKEAILQVC